MAKADGSVVIGAKHAALREYYVQRESLAAQGVTHEMAVRDSFKTLLSQVAREKQWTLVLEQSIEGLPKRNVPDGTMRDNNTLPRGYWEAKDTRDDLNAEIEKKLARGYPRSNIIFEDTRRAMLYQSGELAGDYDLSQAEQVATLLTRFLNYTEPNIVGFEQAVARFKQDTPGLAKGLLERITEAHKSNKLFQSAYAEFMTLCQTALNPNISRSAVDEMLIQHLLTERLMRTVFDNPDFARRNAIAAEVEKVIDALMSKSLNRTEFLGQLGYFYEAIEAAAEDLTGFAERQTFINTVYERFFQGYAVKVADTHGIVYTPQPIVDFMCAAVEEVLRDEFGLALHDEQVCIIDPCTGTGNFMINLLHRIHRQNPAKLPEVYANRLFANEVMLLPYYIASLNIEHAYHDLTRQYEPFDGLCFVDTLDLAESKQMKFDFITEKNSARVKRQKEAPITVIIGNPPYNVGQVNENDNNKNRKYDEIDKHVRETYAKDSKATLRMQLYDPYVKFFRWASDRLQGRDGVVCYVSNNSFVDQIAFDGMRKHLLQDFSCVYHLDLHGNVRQNPKLSGTTHNVFGIQVGVGITVAVRSSQHKARKLLYHRVPEMWRKEEKLAWLTQVSTPLPMFGEGQGVGLQMPPERRGWAVQYTNSPYYQHIKPLARQMRSDPTPAENHLWQQLRHKRIGNYKFRRQHVIDRFVVDFYCAEARLVIEVDGSIHEYTREEDALRQAFLESIGLRVVRFMNEEVFQQTAGVVARIGEVLEELTRNPSPVMSQDNPTPDPSPNMGRGTLQRVPFRLLTPDAKQRWLAADNADEFATYTPMGSKEGKAVRGRESETIFKLYSAGLKTNRDDTVYDFSTQSLTECMKEFIENYNSEVDRYRRAGRPADLDGFVKVNLLKWDGSLKERLKQQRYGDFSERYIRNSLYRPFSKKQIYFDWLFINRTYQFTHIFPTPETEQENRIIWLKTGSEVPVFALMANTLVDLLPQGGSQCFPFYIYDEDGTNRRENITDWSLKQFRQQYDDESITKWDIFYYVYALLHHPQYRERYADALKRELPRIPMIGNLTPAPSPNGEGSYAVFGKFVEAGTRLAELHLNYETVEPYPLHYQWVAGKPVDYRVTKMRLNKEKTALIYNDALTLAGIPREAFEYRLGNRSALDWVIDQYQVKTGKNITSDPNQYSEDEKYIVELVGRVIQVSVETMKLIRGLPPMTF